MPRNSQGRIGETLAEHWFRSNGWIMERHQPPTRVVKIKGRLMTIPCQSTGIPDYSGYELVYISALHDTLPIARYCEVKEAHGSSMSWSRLGKFTDPFSQNSWMKVHDHRTVFVAVCWLDHNCEIKIYKWKPEGAYKYND